MIVPPYLEQTARYYQLDKWAKEDERRKAYFRGIDHFKSTLRGIVDRDPTDDKIVKFLMLTLENDGTFSGHIGKWKDGSKLMDAEFWTQLYEAGANMVLLAYVDACERSEWPEER